MSHPLPRPLPRSLDQRLDALARHPFRAKFPLRGRERATAELSGPATMRWHAYDLIAKRLATCDGDVLSGGNERSFPPYSMQGDSGAVDNGDFLVP